MQQNVLLILTSSSKKKAKQNIRSVNYLLSQELNESDDRFIAYDFSTKTVSTIRKTKDLTQMLKFTNSIDEFVRLIERKEVDSTVGIILTPSQLSELKLKHNTDKL